MPPRRGRWRSDAKATWDAWCATTAAALWDETQWIAAGRLLVLVHELAGDVEGADRTKLLAELRRGELGLGLRVPGAKPEHEAKAVRSAELEAYAAEENAVEQWRIGGTGPRPATPVMDAARERQRARSVEVAARERPADFEGSDEDWRRERRRRREREANRTWED